MLRNITKLLAISIILSSCGGGGGGGGAASSSTTSSTITISEQWQVSDSEADVYRTSEYERSYSISGTSYQSYNLELINAAEAYAVLDKNSKEVAGNGVSIAILDTGVQTDHDEISANYDAVNSYDTYSSDSDPSDGDGHGTHVASIAAGVKDGSGMHGVAYDSTIVAVKVFDDDGNNGSTTTVYNGVEYVVGIAEDNNIKVMNLSLGGDSDDGLSRYKNALLDAKDVDILSVIATGNDGDSQPDYPAYYASDSSLAGYVLAVGAVDEDSDIASFSNHCGNAKNYCLVAPGVDILGAYTDDNYAQVDGTSQATPHVAGAAAVIRAAWPHLTATQTAQILLQSATDLGDAGVDSVYGHGLLDLYKAVQYQGDDVLSYGSSTSSGGYSVSDSSFYSDPIFGDAFSINVSSKLNEAIFIDDFGRDYKANLGSKISKTYTSSEVSLDSFSTNNISSKIMPLSFGKEGQNQIKLNISSFKNPEANNIYGLKFITLDKSQDPQKNLTQGFSFIHDFKNLNQGTKFGFATNIDEVTNIKGVNFYESGFLTQKNFSTDPFNQFLTNSGNYETNRQFNQMFVASDISKNVAAQLSYQSSYDSNQMLSKVNSKQNEVVNAGLFFQASKNTDLMFLSGQLKEFDNNILNSKSAGAFTSAGDAQTTYIKMASSYKLNNWHFLASISEGRSQVNGNDKGIFREFSDIKTRSSSFAVVYNKLFGGSLGLSYSEPMRVYQGSVKIDIPVARDLEGNLTRYQTSASLAPNGKQRNFEIFFNRVLSNNAKFGVNFVKQIEPANDSLAKDNNLVYLNYLVSY